MRLTILLIIANLIGAAEPVAQPALSAQRFVDSMGINLVVYDDQRHDEIARPRLAELGIKHLRVGLRKADHDDYRGKGAILQQRTAALAADGYQLTGIFHCWYSMEEFMAICDAVPLYQAEGPNEPWHAQEQFSWQGKGWPDGPRLFMQDLHHALRSHSGTRDLPILSFSGTTSKYGSIEDLIDFGNEHIYPDNGAAFSDDNILKNKIARCRATNYPTLPLQLTESGYNSGLGDDPGIRPTSPWMQARGVPRLYLEAFRNGINRLFIYGLNMRHDRGFALLNADGSPRQAFTALRDMITLCGGSEQASLANGTLSFALSSSVESVHHLLLQRGDGAFVLVVWNDVDGWDEGIKADRVVEDIPVALSFATEHHLSQYRPVTDGVRPISETTASAITLSVPDHPLMLVIDAPLKN